MKMTGKRKSVIATSIAALLIAVFCFSLAGCGTTKATMKGDYKLMTYKWVQQMAWTIVSGYDVQLYSDDTYIYTATMDCYKEIHNDDNTASYEKKGTSTIITYGTYTSAASADGESTHLEIVLGKATSVVAYQMSSHNRKTVFPFVGNVGFDTDNWTDAMTEAWRAASANEDADMQGFLDEYGKSIKFTIEDPSLEADNTALQYRILEVPVAA